MFTEDSRYYRIETAQYTRPDGKIIRYIRRRFLPQGESLSLLVEVYTAQGDRLDNLAARTLGDPLQSWQICDANDAMNPVDLLSEPGRTLRIPRPGEEL